MVEDLEKREINGGMVITVKGDAFRLSLPRNRDRGYCLAQLDDYMHQTRRGFPHQSPFHMRLAVRVSGEVLSGTWGFGLWNDPFSVGALAGGVRRILPVLPNAAWFFYGSDENHLSLRDDLPASGFHMKTFRSPLIPSPFSLLALPVIPFLLCPWVAKVCRSAARAVVKEDAQALNVDVTEWHAYELFWGQDSMKFIVDDQLVFQTPNVPLGRMGLVIWIDNQYFSFNSKGQIKYGALKTKSGGWLEVRHLSLENNLR